MNNRWTTSEDVAAKVRKRWNDGSLLRSYAVGAPFPEIDVPVRAPRSSEIGDLLDDVRAWIAALEAGSRDGRRYCLEWTSVGGRHFGRNRVPARVRVATYEQAWALLGVASDVRRFAAILELVAPINPVADWVVNHPIQAVELDGQWPALLAAYTWLDAHRGSQRYLREISAPGVDTKLAERQRATLAGLLGVSATASGFLDGLGLRGKPEMVRLRVSADLGLPIPLTELTVRVEELAALDLRPTRAIVIENEISYLSVDVPPGGAVIWGKGFEVDRVGRLPWLADVAVSYWGDLDTHGFAILDRLRAWLPQTRSVLMDRETLVRHRDRWGSEDRPAKSLLTRLTPDELTLYDDLVTDRLGERVRLEQERIDWSWATAHLP